MGLTVNVKQESVIEELIAIFPDFAPLKNLDVAHTKRRKWKRGNGTSFDVQVIFVGKTGYGKSTTVNALIQDSIFESSDIEACTKECQCMDFVHYFSLGDLPGLGESAYVDDTYLEMYSEFLAKTDVAVYVLRADSRDYAVDERAFAKLFCSDETKDRVIIAVNCADKVEPINRSTPFSPTQAQLKNIDQKIKSISKTFDIPTDRIIAYSALESWNIEQLVKIICSRLIEILVSNGELTNKSYVPMTGGWPYLDRRK